MSRTFQIFTAVLWLGRTASIFGQGTFENLDFESAVSGALPSGPAYRSVPVTDALPGWSAYFGTSLQPLISYNTATLGSVGISLLGPGSTYPGFPQHIIEGQYTVLLQGGINPSSNDRDAIILQTGIVPADARSIRAQIAGLSLQVTFAGQQLSLVDLAVVQLPSGFSVRTVGIDVSSFAGQLGELRFIAPYIPGLPNDLYLDALQFSTQPIPEPGAFSLLALGGALVGWRARRRRCA